MRSKMRKRTVTKSRGKQQWKKETIEQKKEKRKQKQKNKNTDEDGDEQTALAKWSILGFRACSPPPTP